MKKLKCLECNKILKDGYEFEEYDKNRFTFTYECSCGDKWQMLFSIPPGQDSLDMREYQQFILWQRKIKLEKLKKKQLKVTIKKPSFDDILENNFHKNIERYNELMEKINPDDLFDSFDDKYELNNLHGKIWSKGKNPDTDKDWPMDINGTNMDYVQDNSELDKGTYVNWKEYWEKRKSNEEFDVEEPEGNRSIFGNQYTQEEITKKYKEIDEKYK